jgi:ribosomal protein S18 acetylase RimI-like enzyme
VIPADHRTIFEAEDEAFRDHWGHRAPTDGDFKQVFSMPELDTSMWQVAWDDDEVAGVVQAWIWPSENEKLGVARGWLEKISVRRPWRRRGLARALTARGLAALRDRGMTDAMLGVDADNPTGALGLYVDLGFEVDQRSTTFRRPISD